MHKRIWITLTGLAALTIAGLSLYPQSRGAKPVDMQQAVAFRLRLGMTDNQATDWSGSVAVSTGRIESIQGWRFRGQDTTDGKSSWTAWSGRSLINIGRNNAGTPPPTLANGVTIAVSSNDPSTRIDVKTKQGDFSFAEGDVLPGARKRFLDNRILVERVPNTVRLTTSLEDEDYPAIAQSADNVYASYVQFVRGDRKEHRWMTMGDNPPKSFDFVARPVGGDQVFLSVFSKGKRTWSEPLPVTATGQDIMRTAVAVDGSKRVWVFYSANRKNNFDLYAKSYANGRWSAEQRLTTDEGTDINPVAATDASGRVWIAWQAFRNSNLEILAAAQQGDRFTREATVSFSKASDWDPSIATAPNGEVAIAWDTYDKGDYDVYFRRLKLNGAAVQMDTPTPVAASDRFEARASAAYDRDNRLWVAYERPKRNGARIRVPMSASEPRFTAITMWP